MGVNARGFYKKPFARLAKTPWIIPAYWPMRAFWSAAEGEHYFGYLVLGAISCAVAVALAAHVFDRKLLRRV